MKRNENKDDEDDLKENENISIETGIQALKYSMKFLQHNEIAEKNELLYKKHSKRIKDQKNVCKVKLFKLA